jgi:cell division protein ZapE
MPQNDAAMSPRDWYRTTCDTAGFISDAAQTAAVEELEALWRQLVEFKNKRDKFLGRSLLSPEVPRGLYIWGGIGRGKTFLMDGFYHCLPYRRKRRIHFHHFMSDVHQQMKQLADMPDPLIALAEQIAQSTRLLCLDELHVDDIADAMILGRLFEALFKRGVVLLVTSNYPPDELYPNGLQRQHFLPAIEIVKQELKVLHFEGSRDYRMLQRVRDPVFIVSDKGRMASMFLRLTMGSQAESALIGGVPAKHVVRNNVWFDFDELCGGNHDQSDYLRIADRYATVFLSDVPKMTAENAAEARRFTWLIDVLYDNGVKLVANFAVAPDRLYEVQSPESLRILSRLAEMQTRRYLESPHQRCVVPD